MRLPLAGALLAAAALSACDAGASPARDPVKVAPPSAVRQLLLDDAVRPHEARPHGVPSSYDWAAAARRRPLPHGSERYGALTGWGQLYRCADRPAAGNAQVELRDMRTYVLRRGAKRWARVQGSSALAGASYPEDFKGSTAPPRLYRRAASGTRAGVRPGFNFHFWPATGRVAIASHEVAAITVSARARLVRGGGSCLLLGMGADFWADRTSGGTPRDAGVGRLKLVRRRWRTFTMTTADPGLLARRPVPLRVAAGEVG